MRFLIVSKSRYPMPLEATLPLLKALEGWLDANLSSGKMEQAFGFAGHPAGGGILNVESFEELDALMARYPIAPFYETEIYPLSDIHLALHEGMQGVQMMLQQP